jgi:hypothetical protein
MMKWVGVPPAQRTLDQMVETEAKAGYSALPTVGLAGAAAAVAVVVSVPLAFLLLNALVAGLSGARRIMHSLNPLPLLSEPRLYVFLAVVGALGLGAALLRRYSIRRGLFWEVSLGGGTARFGLDDLLVLLAGTPLLWWVLHLMGSGALIWWMLGGTPFIALIFHSAWEAAYEPLIRRCGRIAFADQIALIVDNLVRHVREKGIALVTDHHYDAVTGVLDIIIDAQREDAVKYIDDLLRGFSVIRGHVQVRVTRRAS